MTDSYNDQRDVKLQLDYSVDLWWTNQEKYKETRSESGRSSKSLKSGSVKERRRLVEEAKFKMQTLREKKDLERQIQMTQQS